MLSSTVLVDGFNFAVDFDFGFGSIRTSESYLCGQQVSMKFTIVDVYCI